MGDTPPTRTPGFSDGELMTVRLECPAPPCSAHRVSIGLSTVMVRFCSVSPPRQLVEHPLFEPTRHVW